MEEMIYGESVQKHTKIMRTWKRVNIIFGWNVKTTKVYEVFKWKVVEELLMYNRCPINKSGNVYEGEIYSHDEETIVCYFCGKVDTWRPNAGTYLEREHPITHFPLTRKDPKRFGYLRTK